MALLKHKTKQYTIGILNLLKILVILVGGHYYQ